MQELFRGFFESMDDRADVSRLAQSISHHFGVIMLILDDQNLGAGGGAVGCGL